MGEDCSAIHPSTGNRIEPSCAFLMELNYSGAPDWARQVSDYEGAVTWLNDTLGHYLLPSFIAGASISILMFTVTANTTIAQSNNAAMGSGEYAVQRASS